MGNINLLDKHVAELIAAGEVVERPASVVKELLENCIDAGATSITAEIQNGGVSFIRITDNGSGILREDVPTAFLRHATSKVREQPDLDSIATLGFRGEALASVAAVSRVELLTKTADDLAGTRYVIEGGTEILLEDTGCPKGTTIVIRDIFYNIPARMKFLKKDVAEGNAVAVVMERVALSRPDISFKFIRNGRIELKTPGNKKLLDTIFAVHGKDFAAGLIPLCWESGGVEVTGYLTKPMCSRPNRIMQQQFINGRYVRSRTISTAIEEACKGSLMAGRFPGYVLQMKIPFETIDVNVHPAKIEVRFINERPIFEAVYHAAKQALSEHDAPNPLKLPIMPSEQPLPASFTPPPIFAQERHIFSEPQKQSPQIIPSVGNLSEQKFSEEKINIDISVEDDLLFPRVQNPLQNKDSTSLLSSSADSIPTTKPESDITPFFLTPTPNPSITVIGEAFSTYIITQRNSHELYIIDKHAVHERLIYERLLSSPTQSSQQLLVPVPVTLDKDGYGAVIEHLNKLTESGFDVEDFGNGAVLVRGVPPELDSREIPDMIHEIAGYLCKHKNSISIKWQEWLYHNIACRAAIKAGDKSSPQELAALVLQLESNKDVRYCPHGRPVGFTITKKELEKQFGRT